MDAFTPFRKDASGLQEIDLEGARHSSLADVLLIAATNAEKLKTKTEIEGSQSLYEADYRLPLARLLFDCLSQLDYTS